jgi:hypothetical protein
MGKVGALTPGEISMAGAINKIPSVPLRTWEYWATRLAKRGGMPPRPGTSAAARKGPSSRSGSKAAAAGRGKTQRRSGPKGRKKR